MLMAGAGGLAAAVPLSRRFAAGLAAGLSRLSPLKGGGGGSSRQSPPHPPPSRGRAASRGTLEAFDRFLVVTPSPKLASPSNSGVPARVVSRRYLAPRRASQGMQLPPLNSRQFASVAKPSPIRCAGTIRHEYQEIAVHGTPSAAEVFAPAE